jgi:cytochrome P450
VDLDSVDYFNDPLLALDPYGLLDYLAANRPVYREPHHGVVMVSGYEEALAVFRAPDVFSSASVVAGANQLELFPAPPPSSDDITDWLREHRTYLPQNDQIVTADPPVHTAQRALLMGLITPKRLKENEEFIWRLTDRQLDAILEPGTAEVIGSYAQPYTLLVIADLLGVPEADHAMLMAKPSPVRALPGASAASTPSAASTQGHNTLEVFYDYFTERIEDRRRQPRTDVLTGIAAAKFPDGSQPTAVEVARIVSNLFAAGQETTVRLIGAVLQRIAEQPEIQAMLRANRDQIPRFVEETLRTEGPVKGEFRLAVKTTELGGVPIPAGTPVMVMNGAANRDPRQFECPADFRVDRANTRRHLAFGHGIHTCPGAPLARSEARITVERLLDRTTDIRINEAAHGPAHERQYTYLRTYMFRGLRELHLDFTPRA